MMTPKVWKSGEFLYGYCGSLRAGQILQHIFAAPQLPDDDTDDAIEKYLVQEWSEALRSCFLDSGHAKIKHEVQTANDTWFLLGVRGRLYQMQGDYSVWRVSRGYQAIGSGEQFALGALEVMSKQRKYRAERMILTALAAAAEHAPTVGPPFNVVTTVVEHD